MLILHRALDRQAKACLSSAFPLKGSEGDLCQSPHWGYLIEGEITVTYSDKQEEITSAQGLAHNKFHKMTRRLFA